ncbi:MAG TPA: response regulator [Methanomassiliicoccales archaeon]|nr:response regulator [Methanomassiliicoccales archaeon]
MPANVLVIDDDAEVRNLLLELLKGRGFSANAAGTGADGLKELSAANYELVVLDVHLPDTEGPKLIEDIRARSRDTQIILITGEATLATAIEGIRKHIFDYIPKPFKFSQLMQSIEDALDNQRLTSENRRMLDELTYLNNVTNQISRTVDEDAIMRSMLSLSVEHFHADGGAIYLKGENCWNLCFDAGVEDSFRTSYARIPFHHAVSMQAASAVASFKVSDVNGNSTAWVAVPLRHSENPIGLMILISHSGMKFGEPERRLLTLVGGQVGSSLFYSIAFNKGERRRAFLEGLIDNTGDAVITYTPDGIVRDWNPAATKLYHYESSEATARYLPTVPQDQVEEEKAIISKVMSLGEGVRTETVRLRKGGASLRVEVEYSPVRDSAGNVIAVASISREAAEKKETLPPAKAKNPPCEPPADVMAGQIVKAILPRPLPSPSEDELPAQRPPLNAELREILHENYLGGNGSVDAKQLGGGLTRFFNELGGDFHFEADGASVTVMGNRCPWHSNEHNPTACVLTKDLAAAFAITAWGEARVSLTHCLANHDDYCRIAIKRLGESL